MAEKIEFNKNLCKGCMLGGLYKSQLRAFQQETATSLTTVVEQELKLFTVEGKNLSASAQSQLANRMTESLLKFENSNSELKAYQSCFDRTGCMKQKLILFANDNKQVKYKLQGALSNNRSLLQEIQQLVDTIMDLSIELEHSSEQEEQAQIFRKRVLDRVLLDIIIEGTSDLNPNKSINFLKDVIPRPLLEPFLVVIKELLGKAFVATLQVEVNRAITEFDNQGGLSRQDWLEFQDSQAFKDIVAALKTQLAQQAQKESFQAWCHNKLQMVDSVSILILKRVLESLGKDSAIQMF